MSKRLENIPAKEFIVISLVVELIGLLRMLNNSEVEAFPRQTRIHLIGVCRSLKQKKVIYVEFNVLSDLLTWQQSSRVT